MERTFVKINGEKDPICRHFLRGTDVTIIREGKMGPLRDKRLLVLVSPELAVVQGWPRAAS